MNRTASHRAKPEKKAIVAFFAGTGFDFSDKNPNHLAVAEDDQKPTVDPSTSDQNMADLYHVLPDNSKTQSKHGYHGCHKRRTKYFPATGGAFASGIEQPAEDLHAKLIDEIKRNPNEEITLVLTAHSRGCLSAMLLAKKVSKDDRLKDKVKIILDLHDPVPGNFPQTSKFAKGASAAGRFADLSLCKCIKSAHITVQESGVKGTIDYAFSVLIPRFSSVTALEIDALPGSHSTQETYDASQLYHYQLGIYKTLQLYLENDVHVDLDKAIEKLKELHKVACIYQESEKLMHQNLIAMLELIKTHQDDKKKANLLLFIQSTQCLIYQQILARTKLTKPIVVEREIHSHAGGGIYTRVGDEQSGFLNQRHAEMDRAQKQSHKKISSKIYLGYKGPREDLQARSGKPGRLSNDQKKMTPVELRQYFINHIEHLINDEQFWRKNLGFRRRTPTGIKQMRERLKKGNIETNKLFILKDYCARRLNKHKSRQKITSRFYDLMLQAGKEDSWSSQKQAKELIRQLNAFEESYGIALGIRLDKLGSTHKPYR